MSRFAFWFLAVLLVFGGATIGDGARFWLFATWVMAGSGIIAFRLASASRPAPKAAIWIASGIVFVLAIQLVPLPSEALALVPGQTTAAGIRTLVGDDGWHTLSLDPTATLGAAFPVLVFLVSMLFFATGRGRTQRHMFTAIAATAAFSLLIGIVQKGGSGGLANFYGTPHAEFLPGIFANRNHAAIFLACGVVCAMAPIASFDLSARLRLVLGGFVSAIALAAILATGSRAGLVIGTAMMAAAWFALRANQAKHGSVAAVPKRWVVAVGLVALAVFLPLALKVQTIADTAGRFEGIDSDLRWQIYENGLALAASHFPFGSGLGTFVPLYAGIEPIEQVWASYINHAHSDWLELSIETGLLWVPIVMGIVWIIRRRAMQRHAWSARARLRFDLALIVLLGLASHSLVDYPVRSPTLAIVLALCLSIVTRVQRRDET